MGADDDADCVEHVFDLTQLHLTVGHSAAVKVCRRCGAPAYDDLTPSPKRPKL